MIDVVTIHLTDASVFLEKYCRGCGRTLPTSAFRLDASRKGGFEPQCRSCRRSKVGKSERRRYAARKARQIAIVNEKKSTGCLACGEMYPACLDLHHRPGEVKMFTIGDRADRSEPNLRAELDKCDVLCANCHRKHHAETMPPSHS